MDREEKRRVELSGARGERGGGERERAPRGRYIFQIITDCRSRSDNASVYLDDTERDDEWQRARERAPAFPREILEHIFTSILRARLCRMQIAAAVSRDVWPRMGGTQYPPDGKGHPTCTIRCNTRRDNILLVQMALTPASPPSQAAYLHTFAYLRSIFTTVSSTFAVSNVALS